MALAGSCGCDRLGGVGLGKGREAGCEARRRAVRRWRVSVPAEPVSARLAAFSRAGSEKKKSQSLSTPVCAVDADERAGGSIRCRPELVGGRERRGSGSDAQTRDGGRSSRLVLPLSTTASGEGAGWFFVRGVPSPSTTASGGRGGCVLVLSLAPPSPLGRSGFRVKPLTGIVEFRGGGGGVQGVLVGVSGVGCPVGCGSRCFSSSRFLVVCKPTCT